MTTPRIVETFNTHRILPDVVRELATGRDDELRELLQEIRHAATHPETPPQHMIVYGERGSGKSFLMRLVEIEGENLARSENLPLVFVLLPEEQYNIKTAPQILEVVAAKVRGDDWSASAYSFDPRPPAKAWEAAGQALSDALDRRFGEGRGLAVVMIENFDALSRNLFGTGSLESTKKGKGTKSVTNEPLAAEERFRALLGKKGARFMLIATATGTVDLDYNRPLFLAFKALDPNAWDGDACIAYFNKRRKLQGLEELTVIEEARARAIAEFIGGNPRLAQLLAEVLASPDARTIAQTLDALSDHLADYYRRRLDDLPSNTAGLLDALIRKGEPCSQSELATRVGVQQSQIADAFSYLTQARLLAGDRARDGRSTLYRVRDRLFVHFYRRRYGGEEHAVGLTPIVELLAAFFTTEERSELARRHLEAREFAEARVFRGLNGGFDDGSRGYDEFRDALVMGPTMKLWDFAGLSSEDIEPARIQLRDHPEHAYKRWSDAAKASLPPLQRTVAKILQAVAASRLNDDEGAQQLLADALIIAKTDVATDAQILAIDWMAPFIWYRLKDHERSVEQLREIQDLADKACNVYPKICAYLNMAFAEGEDSRYVEAISAADMAADLADKIEDSVSLSLALRYRARSLGQLGRYEEAVAASKEAAMLARRVGSVSGEARSLSSQAWCLSQLKRNKEAVSTYDQAIVLARTAKDLNALVQCLGQKSFLLFENDQFAVALATIQEALAINDQSVHADQRRLAFTVFSDVAMRIPASDVVARLQEVITETPAHDRWFDWCLDQVMAAVTRAEQWAELREVVREHQEWFAKAGPFPVFNRIGSVWTDFLKEKGRAETFSLVARDLLIIAEVMQSMPRSSHVYDVIAGVVSTCDDPGFLRDLSPLIVEVFGTEAEDEAQRLLTFAEFHTAEDKEKMLQRLNPDLAKTIRLMWNVPEPEDILARRGRPKGR